MSRARIEKRLRDVSAEMKRLRSELMVADEQLQHFQAEADDTRLRSLVSETPVSDREYRHAQRHADKMSVHRAELATQLAALEQSQDDLLDKLLAESG